MKYSLHARHLLKAFCDSAHSVFPATPWSTWRPQFQVRKMKVNILLIVLQLWTEEPEFEHRKCSCKAPALFSVNRVSQSVQSLSHVWLFLTPWTAACQPSLSITNSQSLLKLMYMESMMPSNHLILCHPRLLLPPIPPSIRLFSNESPLHIRWPEYWSFSFSISPSDEHSGLISFRTDWLDFSEVHGTLKCLL